MTDNDHDVTDEARDEEEQPLDDDREEVHDDPEVRTRLVGNAEGARFEIIRDLDENQERMYYWMLFAKNGTPIATSIAGFKQISHTKTAIESVKLNAPIAPLIRLYE